MKTSIFLVIIKFSFEIILLSDILKFLNISSLIEPNACSSISLALLCLFRRSFANLEYIDGLSFISLANNAVLINPFNDEPGI